MLEYTVSVLVVFFVKLKIILGVLNSLDKGSSSFSKGSFNNFIGFGFHFLEFCTIFYTHTFCAL
jgi:hypothetical protein